MCLLGVFEVKAVTSFWFTAAGRCVYVLSLLISRICLVSLKQKSDDAVYTYMDKIPCAIVLQVAFQLSFCYWLPKCRAAKAHLSQPGVELGVLCGGSCAACVREAVSPILWKRVMALQLLFLWQMKKSFTLQIENSILQIQMTTFLNLCDSVQEWKLDFLCTYVPFGEVLIVLYYSFLVIGRPFRISGQREFPFF